MNSLPAEIPHLESRFGNPPITASCRQGTSFGCPRDSLHNRYVNALIAPRPRGLTLGINLNSNQTCNFDCVYCEVNREASSEEQPVDCRLLFEELDRTLRMVHSGQLQQRPLFSNLPAALLELKQVAVSGDGEPTLCPNFAEAMETVVHLRAGGKHPFFKLALLSNAARFDLEKNLAVLELFGSKDEVWLKLDAGSPEHFARVNRPDCTFDRMIENILRVAERRPVVIQSLIPSLHGQCPPGNVIEEYAKQLLELKLHGAQLALVQICSATRYPHRQGCGHLPLKTLSTIARRVREVAKIPVEVF